VEAPVVKGKKAAQNVGVKLTTLLPTGFACYFVASAKALGCYSILLLLLLLLLLLPPSFLCTSVLPKDP
jgi:hypothetical protein